MHQIVLEMTFVDHEKSWKNYEIELLNFCGSPAYGGPGQMWYLSVAIPDISLLYFYKNVHCLLRQN